MDTRRRMMILFMMRYPKTIFLNIRFSSAILNSWDVISPSDSSSSMERFMTTRRKVSTENYTGPLCVYGKSQLQWVTESFPNAVDITDWDSETMERITKSLWVLSENPDHLSFVQSRPKSIFITQTKLEGFAEYKECVEPQRVLPGCQDIFYDTPSKFIFENMETSKPSYMSMVDKSVGEHGNNLGLLHENVIHADITLEEISEALDSLAWANHIDMEMYRGNWDLYNYFSFFAYCIPCSIVNGRSRTRNNASMWTKYLNGCMKQKKLSDLNVDMETLQVLRMYAEKGQNVLNLPSKELDTLKIGDFFKTLKQKTIQKLKKSAS